MTPQQTIFRSTWLHRLAVVVLMVATLATAWFGLRTYRSFLFKVEKVTDYAAITGYGIAATPGMHAGGLPKQDDLARWLAASDPAAAQAAGSAPPLNFTGIRR
jgi:hypothetical protein